MLGRDSVDVLLGLVKHSSFEEGAFEGVLTFEHLRVLHHVLILLLANLKVERGIIEDSTHMLQQHPLLARLD